MLGTRDRGDIEVEPLGLLEIKTSGPGQRWETIPEHYQSQGQWQMHCTGLDRVWFAALLGRRLDIHELARDQADIDFMVRRVETFWADHVVTGTPPPTDGHEATLRALATIYPKHTPGESVVVDDMVIALDEWRDAKTAIKRTARIRDEAAAEIKARLGEAEEGTVEGARAVSWRTQSRTALDEDQLKADHPELVKQYQKTTEHRVLRDHRKKTV